MASNNNNSKRNNANFGANFNQFQNAFKSFIPGNSGFDFDKINQIQQDTLESLTEANRILFDGLQKLAKSQSEFIQEQAQIATDIVSQSLSAKSPEENLDKLTKYAQQGFDTNLQNLQNAAKSASDTSVKVFDIVNKQAVQNLSELSRATKKAANA